MHTLDQELRSSQFVCDVFLFLARPVLEHLLIDTTDTQLRDAILIEQDMPLPVLFDHVQIGGDVASLLGAEATTGDGLKILNHTVIFDHVVVRTCREKVDGTP